MRTLALNISLALIAATSSPALSAAAAEPPPNFVVILTDDLGYGDLSCYGSKTISTPRIDQLAREGIRFTNAYAGSPFCSPSRAALLTGRLPARCGLPYVLFPAERHGLPTDEITLAELLQERGYATACIGKWHIGWARPFRPLQHGFDVFFGTPYANNFDEWPKGAPFAANMGFLRFPLLDGDKVIEAPADQAFLTKRYTERAVDFIRRNKDRPFFLYLPHSMPHIPQYASPEFEGKSKGGLFGDTIEEIDWSVGVIVDTLRELDIDRRTVVVFTSDNGAGFRAAETAPTKKGPPRAQGEVNRALAGSNGMLRRGKGSTFEGGMRIPLIVWSPGRISARGADGTIVSHLDLLPAFASLAGAGLPADRAYDGSDIAPLLVAGRPPSPKPFFFYFGYQPQAVRDGRWKLFVKVDERPHPRPVSLWFDESPERFESQHRLLPEPELYDMENDPGETRNVAKQHPEVVARLTRMVKEFDAALQKDKRPMQFAPGPAAPAIGAIRTDATDLRPYLEM